MLNDTNQAISLSNIIILGRQGRGATSHVFLTQSTRNKQLYAMKVIDKKANKYDRATLQRQLQIHKGLSHLNIVKLINHLQDNDNHYVFTEYCQQGQMTRLLMSQLSEQNLASIVLQVAEALDYLHTNNIAHCDIKLSNMLVHQGKIKLCDFGYSQKINQAYNVSNKNICGTLFYLAPQILKSKCRNKYFQADIWALGICLLILATKKQPYSGKSFQQIRDQILKGDREPLLFGSQQLKIFIDRLLEMDPKKRITLKELKAHPFIIKYNLSEQQQLQISKFHNNFETNIKKSQKFGVEEEKVSNLISLPYKIKSKDVYKKNPYANQLSQSIINKIDTQLTQSSITDSLQKQTHHQDKQQTDNILSHQNINQIDIQTQSNNISPIFTNSNLQENLPINPIQSRLILPLTQFYYQTKNEGFIRIRANGDLQIKVKNVLFSIIQKGQILKLGKSQFTLKKLNNSTNKHNMQICELYRYASQMIQILKNKKYKDCWTQKFKNNDALFGKTRNQKLICLAMLKQKPTAIQYSFVNKKLRAKTQGQKWKILNEQQLNQDLRQLINLINLRSCSLQ